MRLSLHLAGTFPNGRKSFPFPRRREAIKILIGTLVYECVTNLDDALQAEKCSHINLILTEEFRIVAEAPKKPAEFPERFVGGIQSSNGNFLFKRLWLQNHKGSLEERFSRLPAKERTIDSNQKTSFQTVLAIGPPQMQTRNLPSHCLTS
jgi:hypothetical protein